jgi:hypothetical protein
LSGASLAFHILAEGKMPGGRDLEIDTRRAFFSTQRAGRWIKTIVAIAIL